MGSLTSERTMGSMEFLSEAMQARRVWSGIFQVFSEKNHQPRNQQNYPSRWRKNKDVLDKQRLREFTTSLKSNVKISAEAERK